MAIWNERIRERRLEKGITLAQIAERLGVTEATAQRYECGNIKSIPYEYMCAYGEILNCSPCYLMGWENKEESPKIMKFYEKLNDIGKDAATEQVRLLTLDEKYTRPDNIIPLYQPEEEPIGNAAHRRTDLPEHELTPEMQQEDEDIMKNF